MRIQPINLSARRSAQMGIKMDKVLLVMCGFLNCFVITAILFQFMNGRYKRNIKKNYIYFLVEAVAMLFIASINYVDIPLLNLLVWLAVVSAAAYFLYDEDVVKPWHRILECDALLLCMGVCEALGVICLQWLLQTADMENIDVIGLQCLESIFPTIVIIFFYYIVISRLMKKGNTPYSRTQYIIYFIMLGYSFINMLVIIEIFIQGQINYLCMINMGCIVLADLYLLYFVKISNEKSYYENQVRALEQQANIQYEYYLDQSQKYDRTVQILHDVKKHIKTIGDLCTAGQGNMASEYVNELGSMLNPLIPNQYTENPIFNILLTDKETVMKDKGIHAEIKIDNVSMDFIEPIDVTTIFGNLLDNAIEAVQDIEERYISIKISSRHQMVIIRIENSCGEVKWKNNMPISKKGTGRGIGLLNVQNSIKKYDGNLNLRQAGQRFIVEIFMNS